MAAVASRAGPRCEQSVAANDPLRSLLATRGGGWKRIDRRSQLSVTPPSPQCSNLRVGPQLPLHIVTAGPEDDASGSAGPPPSETFAPLPARPRERPLA